VYTDPPLFQQLTTISDFYFDHERKKQQQRVRSYRINDGAGKLGR